MAKNPAKNQRTSKLIIGLVPVSQMYTDAQSVPRSLKKLAGVPTWTVLFVTTPGAGPVGSRETPVCTI